MKEEGFDRTYENHIKEDRAMKEVIDKTIEDFNFRKVHKAMVVLNWVWSRSNGVPTIGELVLCAQELLQEVSKKDVGAFIGTGGFWAKKIKNEDDGEGLELEFILTESTFYTKWLDEKE